VPHAEIALAWYGDDPEVLAMKVRLDAGLGRCAEARQALTRVTDLDPEAVDPELQQLVASCR
jgi:hypothetical protein